MLILRSLLLAMCLGLFFAPTSVRAATGCAALPREDLTALPEAASQITAATPRTGDLTTCVVDGYTSRAVGWRLFLPAPWNGKLIQEGCGGRCGTLRDTGCSMLIRRGYACIAADLGHAGSNFDAVWAIENPVAEMDAAFRATHVANRVARDVVRRFYGRPPTRVYYTAVSAGGRQGLISAQRYPDDFDGIIVGGPAMTRGTAFDRFPSVMVWASSLLVPDGHVLLPSGKIRALHAAVLAACDRADGLIDGVVSLPAQCRFDPATLACPATACLSQPQIAAVRALYAGMPVRDGLDPHIAFLPGSELAWLGDYVTEADQPGARVPLGPTPAANPYESVLLYSADPDLRAFAALGHKLLVFQGLADTITPPGRTIDYVQQVRRTVGSTLSDTFLRFYLVPGMAHEPGEPAADAVDWLGALEAWIEQNRPPATLVARHLRDARHMLGPTVPIEDLSAANTEFTRPLYPFPMVAGYRRGKPADAGSFTPRTALP